MTHDRILIATDDSEPARKAVSEAITQADAFDASLHAISVIESAEPQPGYDDPTTRSGEDDRAEQAVHRVVTKANERGLDPEVVSAVVRGQPASAVLQYANEHDIDLIVVGTHARTGIDRLVVGRVAERISRNSPVPVVTVAVSE
jgi:nucleotide-binding universal stress UspA family protein